MSIPIPSHGRRRGSRRFGPGGGDVPYGPAADPLFNVSFGPGDPPPPPGDDPEFGAGFGPGFRRGMRHGMGRAMRGFGPGGPGFGPGGPGLGGPRGPRGRGERSGRGGRRGNVRAAVLALLAEQPRHGYAIMTELAERSGGLWRPSPGSVYPVLQQLQDEGLVLVEEADGRRIFTLSEAGRVYVAEHPDETAEPWRVAETGPMRRVQSLMFSVQALGAAAEQVARLGDDVQAAHAVAALDEARKRLYRILADSPGSDSLGSDSPGPAGPAADTE
ncbi:MAG TPA: PadR family transcriptional regulator [Kineosporiaceae bacterium]